jgi:hypothetical protein
MIDKYTRSLWPAAPAPLRPRALAFHLASQSGRLTSRVRYATRFADVSYVVVNVIPTRRALLSSRRALELLRPGVRGTRRRWCRAIRHEQTYNTN